MMPAAKHGDMQMGVDIHLCLVPTPAPTPIPLPTPHMSIIFDPFDYLPIIGATVTVCGMKRATAGTNGIAVHIPPGFPFAPKPPDKDDELFMGSATVIVDGDPMSHVSHPVLACQVAGMMSPFRPRKKGWPMMMVLPTVFNLATPSTVFIGGPPTISMLGMAAKGVFAGLGRFAKSGIFKRLRQKAFKGMKPNFLKCIILRAEPVNILNGAVSLEHEDFTLPGRIPIEWFRTYSSADDHVGICGRGWQTIADIRLVIDATDQSVLMHGPMIGPLSFERLPRARGEAGYELELSDGARLTDQGTEWQVRTKEDRIYHFPRQMLKSEADGASIVPIGCISDLCGNRLDFEYHTGQLVAINESAGRRIALTIKQGRLAAVTLEIPASRTQHVFVRYEYDAAGDLAAVIDALGHPYRFAYEQHRLLRHTDRNGLSFYYEYDKAAPEDWRVVHSYGDGGLYDYRFQYLDRLNERRITDSLGHVTIVKLNADSLPISEIDPLGGMTIFEYDDVGRTIGVTDQCGHRTGYEYDESGNLLKLTRPDGTTIETKFDVDNKAVTITDPNGARWVQTWDPRGLLIAQTTPLGNVSRYEYDHRGQLVAFTNPRNARTVLAFDVVGNPVSLTDALSHHTVLAYDVLGNVTARSDALGHTTSYAYDTKSRLKSVRLPSGATISCAYDPEDNLTVYVDENRAQTRLEYCGQGEIARRIQADGQSVQYRYDTEERLIGVANQRGETHQLKRDPLGRIVEEIDYWGQSRTYSYSACGHLEQSVDPLGRAITYITDPLGRILRKTMPDPDGRVVPFEESFDYDANGNLVACANAHTRVQRQFDPEGRMVEERQGDSAVIRNTYDAAGNRIVRETDLRRAQATVHHRVRYLHDSLDQTVGIVIDEHPPIAIERDAAGQIIGEQLSPSMRREMEYNPDGYVKRHRVHAKGEVVFDVAYSYDPAGNLTERRDAECGFDRYFYDPIGRITQHLDSQGQVKQYLNDPAWAWRPSRILEHEPLERSVGATTPKDVSWSREADYDGTFYRFDRAGNLVRRDDKRGRLTLSWDANQRVIETRMNGRSTTYRYDPLGRRMEKSNADQCMTFAWDGDTLMLDAVTHVRCDVTSFEGPTRVWAYLPATAAPVAIITGDDKTGTLLHYHNDPNGCAFRLTDTAGKVKWSAKYSLWEAVVGRASDATENPIRFQGQYYEVETGLVYNRYRYLEPGCGAFISPDPLGLLAGVSTYQYAPNPLGWIDPLGLACKVVKAKSRSEALRFAQEHAQVPRVSRGGKSIGMEALNETSRGPNWSKMKAAGSQKLGRENPAGKNKWFEHPDGHPDAARPGVPAHHSSGHVHSTNAKGEEVVFTW